MEKEKKKSSSCPVLVWHEDLEPLTIHPRASMSLILGTEEGRWADGVCSSSLDSVLSHSPAVPPNFSNTVFEERTQLCHTKVGTM